MNIGIIIYSQTGNTSTAAQQFKEKLEKAGHSVEIKQITIVGKPSSKEIRLNSSPEVDDYEALVFASPVQAFSLAQVMKVYLSQLESLKDKKIVCFVTKQLPFNWTGGNQAISQMKNLCETKGGKVSGSAIVNWQQSKREQAKEAFARLSALF